MRQRPRLSSIRVPLLYLESRLPQIPKDDQRTIAFSGFGYAAACDDYKLVVVHHGCTWKIIFEIVCVQVYTLSTGEWREVIVPRSLERGVINPFSSFSHSSTTDGTIYWNMRGVLIAFNILTEEFKVSSIDFGDNRYT